MKGHSTPVLRHVGGSDRVHEIAVVLSPDYAGFQGHFPDDPVLPGMCQVDFAVRASGLAMGREVRIERVDEARFLAKVRPNDDLRVHLTIEPASDGTARVRAIHMVGSTRVAELALLVR